MTQPIQTLLATEPLAETNTSELKTANRAKFVQTANTFNKPGVFADIVPPTIQARA